MAKERKKAKPKPLPKAEPKKRIGEDGKPVKKPVVKAKPEEKQKPNKSDDKYVRIALDASSDERKVITERVISGELKLAYYATDNDKGYHYYLVIKK